jgi:hypothetical protein
MSDREAINEYLFYEFGYDLEQDSSAIADDWPFALLMIGIIHSADGEIKVFKFTADGETQFVLSDGKLDSFPAVGMDLKDLQLQHDGATWIKHQDPIDLATSRPSDDSVPPVSEREVVLKELATGVCTSPRILLGLYLRVSGTYLALIEDKQTGTAIAVGTGLGACDVTFPEASAWRRLAWGIGKMYEEGIL